MAQTTFRILTTSEMETFLERHNDECFSGKEFFPLAIRAEDIARGQTILAEARAASGEGKVICAYHNDPKCWGNCPDHWNPFNKIGFALKRIKCQIHRDGYWNDDAYRLHHTYLRSSSCERLLKTCANKVVGDVNDAARGGGGNLRGAFVPLLNNFPAEDDLVKHVAIGLARLDRHLFYLQKEKIEEKRKEAEFLHEGSIKENQKSHDDISSKSKNRQSIGEAVSMTGRTSSSGLRPKESQPKTKTASKRKRGAPKPQSIQDNGEGSRTSASGYDEASKSQSENDPSEPVSKRLKTQKVRFFKMTQDAQDNGEGSSRVVQKILHPMHPLGPASLPASPLQYIQPKYEELSGLERPEWAKEYKKSSLSEIGLQVGKFDIQVKTPEMSGWNFEAAPGAHHIKKNKMLDPSFEWLAYAILLRVPGHYIKTKALIGMGMEWRGDYDNENKDLEKGWKSSIQTVSRSKKIIQVSENGQPSNKGGWWRIKDVNEEQVKASGGRKQQAQPRTHDNGEQVTNIRPGAAERSLSNTGLALRKKGFGETQ
ncbi:hypothetical protein BDZ45DRAFT_745016 [Acephala macrosclerotiorum]|nr:hypothetical protein BDZ45DRAFT_745016 [Acephala macrosclerotiorum]